MPTTTRADTIVAFVPQIFGRMNQYTRELQLGDTRGISLTVESGTLQLPLYVLALRRLWGLEVAGGLYQPLRPTRDPRPRGLVRSDEKELLEDIGLVSTDILDPEDFEAALTDAEDRAGAAVARMRSGDIDRDPGPPEGFKTHNQCPKYCSYAPICRRERAPLFVIEEEEEEEQAA